MSDIAKHIQRISWRFTTKKPFLPDKEDKAALNEIIKWVNREKDERYNKQNVFAKLSIYALMREIDYFGDIHFAERQIHDVLKMPLVYWLDRFRLMQIMRSFADTKQMLGIEDISDIWDRNKNLDGYLDVEKLKLDATVIKNLEIENKGNLFKSLDSWQQEEINKKMKYFITELLNEYADKP